VVYAVIVWAWNRRPRGAAEWIKGRDFPPRVSLETGLRAARKVTRSGRSPCTGVPGPEQPTRHATSRSACSPSASARRRTAGPASRATRRQPRGARGRGHPHVPARAQAPGRGRHLHRVRAGQWRQECLTAATSRARVLMCGWKSRLSSTSVLRLVPVARTSSASSGTCRQAPGLGCYRVQGELLGLGDRRTSRCGGAEEAAAPYRAAAQPHAWRQLLRVPAETMLECDFFHVYRAQRSALTSLAWTVSRIFL
jgi:hypothetical protein